MPDEKFLKYRAKILAVNTGDQPDRLTQNITVPTFRGYQAGDVIPAGTLLRDIINKEFNSTPPTPKVTISVVGTGTTNPAAGAHNVTYGGDFTFNSATPGTGYKLKDIVVDGETKTAPFTIRNITADKTITVTFEELPPTPTFTVTGVAGEHGSINPTSQTFNENDPVNITFTASPASNYQVDKWQLNGTDAQTGGDTFVLTIEHITAAQEVKVLFKEIPVVPTYTITSQVDGGHGTVGPANAGEYEEGTAVEATTFTASPESGYEVDKWYVNDVEQSGATGTTFQLPAITSIDKNYVVKVKFKEIAADKYYLTVTDATTGITNYGTLEPAASATQYEYAVGGTAASVKATPNSGFRIKSFKVGGVEQTITDKTQAFTYTLNGSEVVKDASTTVVVEFEEITLSIVESYIRSSRTGAIVDPTPENIANDATVTNKTQAELDDMVANNYQWPVNAPANYCIPVFMYPTTMPDIVKIEYLDGDTQAFTKGTMTYNGVDYKWVRWNNKMNSGSSPRIIYWN